MAPRHLTLHCCVAVSEQEGEGLVVQDRPFTATSFTSFLQTYLKQYGEGQRDGDEAAVIILDNASQHGASEVRAWSEEAKIRMLTLPPYSPELSPAELMIRSIKMKLRKRRGEGK